MSAWGIDRQLIDGRFELLEQLGGGGMGMVWRARDTVLHREVALKEVRHLGGFGSDPTAERLMRERVLREARALARLHHPNVVTIHHIVDRPDLPYPWLVMELVTGGSLAGRLERGPLAPAEAARIGRGVLGALRAAHEAGIQHRDVKPANVLLRPDGSPVLTDFGIAALQEASSLTATGSLIGSPEYIAPERVRGEEGNPASDFWSLGMMLYVAVEGHNPLRRQTNLATLAAVLDQPIPEPVHAGALMPVLAGLLVRNAAERPDPDSLDRMLAAAEGGWIDPHASGSGSGAGVLYGSNGTRSFLAPAQTQPEAQPYFQPQSQFQPQPQFQPDFQAEQPEDTGSQPWSPNEPDTGTSPTRTLRPRRFTGYMIGTAVAGVIGAVVWTVNMMNLPSTHGSNLGTGGAHSAGTSGIGAAGAGSTTSATTGATSGSGSGSGGTTSGAGSDTSQSLLTKAGMEAFVSALRSKFGTTTIVGGDFYADTATFRIQNKTNTSNVDEYNYEGGDFTTPTHYDTIDMEDGTVDLSSINWSVLPTLLGEVDAKVKTPNPTDHYIDIDANWFGYGPALLIYSSNQYNGGYMACDTKGNIIRVYTYGS
jgi:serine/threonine protein kinase